jgi:hypothetical protein
MLQHALPVLDFPIRELHTAKRRFNSLTIGTQAWLRRRQIRQNPRRPALSRLPKRLETHNLARP